MSECVLVTGGAGYIGSHVVRELLKAGYEPVVLDNLSSGHRRAVAPPADRLIVGDVADQELVKRLVGERHCCAAIHFAASISVAESVADPRKYFYNNTFKTSLFLNALVDAGVNAVVFSSTAAVYGWPRRFPIIEDDPTAPVNPYGESKLMSEKILQHYDVAYGLKSVALRYFNACGADPDGGIGEDHPEETHLIPIILKVALGQMAHVKIFGADYDTSDGTCVRDYIHVNDLAAAHVLALRYVLQGGATTAFNLGNGLGYTVQQVIDAARTVTGRHISTVLSERRPGDPARLVASSVRIRDVLGWRPQYPELESIISSAWKWHEEYPHGYEDR